MKEKTYHITTELLQSISASQAHSYRIVPVKSGSSLTFITDSAELSNLQQELQIVLGKKVILELELTHIIDNYLQKHYRKVQKQKGSSLVYSKDFLLHIIHEAKGIGSSDIHFEAYEKQNRVRFRIDGKLIERYIVLKDEYPKIINRIKIMAGLDIAEKRLPQDGRINLTTDMEDFDIRVSSLPTLYGEKLVLRILSKNNTTVALANLGFTQKELQLYKNYVKKAQGMVLISGPTGSGKTTTLYATLKLLNNKDTNILTIEDPIEYTLDGVNQVQLKENIGLNFASTLRTFLRQDPDIIMVGEIRDVNTANMAIRAALTGHLVLSSIHTNSAWATISRLIDMDIPPFLIASTLNISVAQRLVRKLCESCKQKASDNIANTQKNILYINNITKHYMAVGCYQCHYTGYKGRKAIYEIIPITKDLTEKIKNKESNIDNYLQKNHITTLKKNAIALVAEGVTSVNEVYSLLL
ncbi:MAG: GspE/PulE family protein [Tenacibaculum sp.]